jgi:hypothetical protein
MGESARPDSLFLRSRLSGALESAQAVSRARARKGDVSRPTQSGGRVTATDEEGRHACVAPTKSRGMPAASCLRLQEVTGAVGRYRSGRRRSRASEGTEVAGSGDREKKNRRGAAVSAQLVTAASLSTIRRSSEETCPVQSEAKNGSRRRLRKAGTPGV